MKQLTKQELQIIYECLQAFPKTANIRIKIKEILGQKINILDKIDSIVYK
tara:strand:- start:385 stop:534 length:150 start_codon:yes stop_codon:yes gene_type:complete